MSIRDRSNKLCMSSIHFERQRSRQSFALISKLIGYLFWTKWAGNHLDTTSVSLTIKSRILASHTIGVISTCKNYEIFMKRLSFGLYILPLLSIHDRIYISFAHAFLEQISSGGLLCTIKSWGDSADN